MRKLAVAATIVLLGAGAQAAGADTLAQQARLQGIYTADGLVTHAVGVRGEYVGEHVTRKWEFTPMCAVGACPTVELTRQRGSRTSRLFNRLILYRQQPGYYTGRGTFTIPIRCGRRVVKRGQRVPFTITLTITSAAAVGTTVLATGFTATYRNTHRIGLTRCYNPPSYDSAHYVGAPATPPPTGSIRRVRRTRPSTGS
jgi:hypothetical protein